MIVHRTIEQVRFVEVLSLGAEDTRIVWREASVATVQHLVEFWPMEGVLRYVSCGLIVFIDDTIINRMLLLSQCSQG